MLFHDGSCARTCKQSLPSRLLLQEASMKNFGCALHVVLYLTLALALAGAPSSRTISIGKEVPDLTSLGSHSRVLSQNSHNFFFSEWTESSIFLSGNATFAADSSKLLLIPGFQQWATTRATFVDRVVFLDKATQAETSFSTSFTFSIRVNNTSYMGDGIAFFIGPSPDIPEHNEGGVVGLHDVTVPEGDRRVQVVAVEFDTHTNINLNDPANHHVGLDINSVVSTVARDVKVLNLTLAYRDVHKMTAWIDYDARQHRIEVRLAHYPTERENATTVLAYSGLSLADLVKPLSYVGFSAATGRASEENTIYSWTFQSWSSDD